MSDLKHSKKEFNEAARDLFQEQVKSVLNKERLPHDLWQGQSKEMLRTAAVLFPFYWFKGEPWVLFTQRNSKLKHHSGQVSFPGGAFEIDDEHIRRTALRETEEEIGIGTHHITMLGHLDPLSSVSGFEVSPFVAFLDDDFQVVKDDVEVERVFGVPFAFFRDPKRRQKQYARTSLGKKHYYVYQYNDDVIWGLTAQIIVQLVKRLEKLS